MTKKIRHWIRLVWKKCPVSKVHAVVQKQPIYYFNFLNLEFLFSIKAIGFSFALIFVNNLPAFVRLMQTPAGLHIKKYRFVSIHFDHKYKLRSNKRIWLLLNRFSESLKKYLANILMKSFREWKFCINFLLYQQFYPMCIRSASGFWVNIW